MWFESFKSFTSQLDGQLQNQYSDSHSTVVENPCMWSWQLSKNDTKSHVICEDGQEGNSTSLAKLIHQMAPQYLCNF